MWATEAPSPVPLCLPPARSTTCSAQHRHQPSLLSPLTFRRMPRAPEESARSLPARSTKLILLT